MSQATKSILSPWMEGVDQVESRMRIVGLLSIVALVALPFGLSGCGTTTSPSPVGLPSLSPTPIDTPTEPAQSSEPTSAATSATLKPTVTPKINTQAEVYWLSSGKTKLELTPAKVSSPPVSNDPQIQLNAAIKSLLSGPSSQAVTTAIPTGTVLKSIAVAADGIHLDLSKDFMSGGGSTSMQSRLGQIIYTASSLNPTDPVWIDVEGAPIKILGGEGLELSQPITREEFAKNFSL